MQNLHSFNSVNENLMLNKTLMLLPNQFDYTYPQHHTMSLPMQDSLNKISAQFHVFNVTVSITTTPSMHTMTAEEILFV
jgi:hypothetical protein